MTSRLPKKLPTIVPATNMRKPRLTEPGCASYCSVGWMRIWLAIIFLAIGQTVRAEPFNAPPIEVPTTPIYRLVIPAGSEAVKLGPPLRGAPPAAQPPSRLEPKPEPPRPLPAGESPALQPAILPPTGLELAPLPAHLQPAPRSQSSVQVPPTTKPTSPPAYVEPLEVPTAERLFRLESERALRERIRQEQRDQGARAHFPEDVAIAPPGVSYQGRAWPCFVSTIPASITAYHPLYFEDKNVERYGWDAGIFQPVLSAGKFYLDLALLPYNVGAQLPWSLEYNAGYALPGDPEPYRIYWPKLSCTGATLESLTVLGILALP